MARKTLREINSDLRKCILDDHRLLKSKDARIQELEESLVFEVARLKTDITRLKFDNELLKSSTESMSETISTAPLILANTKKHNDERLVRIYDSMCSFIYANMGDEDYSFSMSKKHLPISTRLDGRVDLSKVVRWMRHTSTVAGMSKLRPFSVGSVLKDHIE